MRGKALEELVRKSAGRQVEQGLWLIQTSPRFVGRIGGEARAEGRLVSVGGLDFIGDYRGVSVSFDAKTCAKASSFPLANIKNHQALIVRNAHQRRAISFFLVEFAQNATYFAVDWPTLAPWWKQWRGASYTGAAVKASIPFIAISTECVPVTVTRRGLDLAGAIELLAERHGIAIPQL